MINRLAIFGVGLIGGSLALALKKAGFCKTIVGCSRRESHLQQALDLGVVDEWTLDPATAVQDADLVLLAVPVGAMNAVLESIRPHLCENVIITDAGSSKASVVEAVRNVFGEVPPRFIPAHPIAGREQSGVEAALCNLFENHKVILCPLANSDPDAVESVSRMWKVTGATVETLGVEQHDRILAATSHLPHVLAYALVNALAETEHVDQIFRYAAGGFRDFSRIASSDPVMWRDICIENKSAILESIGDYQKYLEQLKVWIKQEDSRQLLDAFAQAKSIRDQHVAK